jgi:hypothetical protein
VFGDGLWSLERRTDRAVRTGESLQRTSLMLVFLVGASVWTAVSNMQHLSAGRQVVVCAVAAGIALALIGITIVRRRRIAPQTRATRTAVARRAQLLAPPCAGVALILISVSGQFALALVGALGTGFFLGGAPIVLISVARNRARVTATSRARPTGV